MAGPPFSVCAVPGAYQERGSRALFLYPDSPRPATLCRAVGAWPELSTLLGGQVPDFRGLFLQGHGGKSAALGVQQGDAIRNIYGAIAGYNGGIRAMGGAFAYRWHEYATSAGNNFNIPSGVQFDASLIVPTAEENRPVNTAVRYLVRARP